MSTVLDEITEQALRLPYQERMTLANRLLAVDETDDPAEIEVAWEEEILARIQAIDDGTVVGVPYEEVKRRALARRAR